MNHIRASCQTLEDLILLLFQVYFYVEDSCVCLYNNESHIFKYFYMTLRGDCFPSIKAESLFL